MHRDTEKNPIRALPKKSIPGSKDSTSCEAAVIVAAQGESARVCEPWVTRPQIFESRGAASETGFVDQLGTDEHLATTVVAAPRLRRIFLLLPKARRLALGLIMTAATQLSVWSIAWTF